MRPVRKDALLFVVLGFGFLVSSAGWSVTGTDSKRSPGDIVVEAMSGTVDVDMANMPHDVEIGSLIALPSRITTAGDGNISIRQSRTGVAIGPDSDVEIPAAASDGQLIARMVQHRGTVFYDVEPRPIEKLRIDTPNLVAVVKGTQFNVVTGADNTTVSLFEGVLEIRSLDGEEVIELVAGQIAIGSDGGGIVVLPMNPDLLEEAAAIDAGMLDESPAQTIAAVGDSTDVDALANLENAAIAEIGVDESSLQTTAAVDGSLTSDSMDVSFDTNLDADADLAGGSVDVGLDTGLDADADLGGGSLDAGLDTGLDAGADLGSGDVDLGADTGLDVDLGDTEIDAGLDVDLGDTDVDADLDVVLDDDGDLVEDLADELDSDLDENLDLGGGGEDDGLSLPLL